MKRNIVNASFVILAIVWGVVVFSYWKATNRDWTADETYAGRTVRFWTNNGDSFQVDGSGRINLTAALNGAQFKINTPNGPIVSTEAERPLGTSSENGSSYFVASRKNVPPGHYVALVGAEIQLESDNEVRVVRSLGPVIKSIFAVLQWSLPTMVWFFPLFLLVTLWRVFPKSKGH